jgi:hypothetical protein
VIEGGKNADVIDGGAGDIDVVVLHGHKADYNVSTEAATGITRSPTFARRLRTWTGPTTSPTSRFCNSTIRLRCSTFPMAAIKDLGYLGRI